MARKKKPSAPDGFPQKKWDKLSTSWRDGAATKSTDELKDEIVKYSQEILTQRTKMKEDDILQASIDAVKERRQDYMEPIGVCQAQIDYILYLMTTRGAA